MCCVGATRLDKGRALWWPSGSAMHLCAVLRRRDHHDQGYRAVRHRGDIRHRRKGSAGRGGDASRVDARWGECRPIAVGVAASAVRRKAVAWSPLMMGPSRSRAARSRTPRRCVREPVAISCRASHVPNACALRYMLRTMVHMPRGAHATWCRRHVVCEPLQVGIRNVLHVAQ
jgi:hypothetical protein